jgi:2-keto-4-pentenoate hydratase/2-oxohepta-3-ene-1,7-dioic acid hydratase in catechol pathway
VIGLAGNYVQHIQESKLDKGLTAAPHADTVPRPFLMPATAVAAPGQEIPWPAYSREIDYEIELAVVVGSPARCVSPAQARACIAGYTIANDVSARSVTFAEGRARRPWDEFYDWMCGKWADGFCPMGPYLVTADEIGNPKTLRLQLRVNGQLRQDSEASAMIFDPYEIVSFLSHLMTLVPGDVIATGTPHGVGMATGSFLQAGDVISCRIDRIGELTNRLGPPPAAFYAPCRRT